MLRRRLEIGFATFLLAALGVLFGIGWSYPPRPRELPLLVCGIGIALVLKQLVEVIRKPASPDAVAGPAWNWKAVFLAFGSMAAYLIATLLVGMLLSSAIIVYGGGLAFGARNKARLAVITGLAVVAVYLVFVVALRMSLYPGLLANLVL